MLHARPLLGAALGAALVSFVGLDLARACDGAHQQSAKVKSITVEQLTSTMSAHQNVILLDANSDETRAKYGIIPGARLLSHYANYQPATELPGDKSQILVFYCGSSKCTAAPQAAEKALGAGYTNVYVLEVGIKGWADAGKSTAQPPETTT